MEQNKLVLHVFETNEGYTYIAKSSSTIDDKIQLEEWTGYPSRLLEMSIGDKRRFYGGVYKDIGEVIFDFYIVSKQEEKVLPETKITQDEVKKKYWVQGDYDKVRMTPLKIGEIKVGALDFGPDGIKFTEILLFPKKKKKN